MALTDLTGTEWVFNDVLDTEEQNIIYALNFQSNNEDFTQLQFYHSSNYPNEMRYRVSSTSVKYVYENGWSYPLYKTITITGGGSVTNSDLITWLKANATWTNQPEGVSISYSGSEIATIEESGTKTLLTNGKYCTDDITITYVRPSGGGLEESDVNFYDYDGTLLYSYTAADFANLAALPANPSHAGLTAQGWNWTLAGAKTYVANYGGLDIGQTYITDNGKTRFYITIDQTNTSLSVTMHLSINGSVIIDWGDSSVATSGSGNDITTAQFFMHTYAANGSYVISVTVISGAIGFRCADSYNVNSLKYVCTKIELGSNCYICGNDFSNFSRCESIIIPYGTFVNTSPTPSGSFWTTSIKCLIIPQGSSKVPTASDCYALERALLPEDYEGNITFSNCAQLKRAYVPENAKIGSSVFYSCGKLEKVVIPDGVTSLGMSVFYQCLGLKEVRLPSGASYGVLSSNSIFYNCYSLEKVIWGATGNPTILGDNMFYHCGLKEFVFPRVSVTPTTFMNTCSRLRSVQLNNYLTQLGNGTFGSCRNLERLTLPSTLTKIGSSAFAYLYSLKELVFESSAPPQVTNANAFNSLPTNCIIKVPTGSLSAYTSATNYPSSGTYTYVEV